MPGVARHACQLLIPREKLTVLRAALSTDAGGSLYGNLRAIFFFFEGFIYVRGLCVLFIYVFIA